MGEAAASAVTGGVKASTKPSTPSAAAAAAAAAATAHPSEYNPRWKGYTLICITSLTTLSSVSTTAVTTKFTGHPGFTVAWSALTFTICFVILVLDRTQCFVETFNYTKAKNGKLEGYMLLSLVVFWIVGVAFITQVNGIGYLTLNTYVGSWLTLAACIYTLNKWSSSKDILSIDELTGVSATLKSWYVVFLSSLVVTGTSINYMVYFAGADGSATQQPDAAVCVALGCVSAVASFAWICVHYRFITSVPHGGWLEVLIAVGVVLCQIVMVALATGEGGIGSTIVGTICGTSIDDLTGEQSPVDNCTVVVIQGNVTWIRTCQSVLASETPGSNLYVFTWLGLIYSLNVCLRWKAQQAIQFAQAQRDRMRQGEARIRAAGDGDLEDVGDDDDDDDDNEGLDDFEDAKNH